MKYSFLAKNVRLVARAYILPLIAVVVVALIVPDLVAWKIREALGFIEETWLNP